MSREKMVTRTMTNTNVVALCLDIDTAEPCSRAVKLPGTYKNQAQLLAAVRKALDTDSLKTVSITDSVEETLVYGCTEAEFLSIARPIQRGANVKNTDNEQEA